MITSPLFFSSQQVHVDDDAARAREEKGTVAVEHSSRISRTTPMHDGAACRAMNDKQAGRGLLLRGKDIPSLLHLALVSYIIRTPVSDPS